MPICRGCGNDSYFACTCEDAPAEPDFSWGTEEPPMQPKPSTNPYVSGAGIPYCRTDDCPSYDGNPCYQHLLPGKLCVPAIFDMIDEIKALQDHWRYNTPGSSRLAIEAMRKSDKWRKP